MDSKMKTGYFQTLEVLPGNRILINDQLHGEHEISEPVLIDLLQSPSLQRLRQIHQHGITSLVGLSPKITRFEHSVGAFLLVRKLHASIEEQVAALLHDISHTTLSHVIDWALSKPGEESYHEVHKARYVKTTELPAIMAKHGLENSSVFIEELFPLVEMPSPHLCADRLDYGLRDSVGLGNLSLQDARRVIESLVAHPGTDSPRRLMVLRDADVGLILARAYLATDRDAWSEPAHAHMYQKTGRVIGDAVHRGSIQEDDLWRLSDNEFWETLRRVATPEELNAMKEVESGLPQINKLTLPKGTKVRSIDPDIWLPNADAPVPLSTLRPEWSKERLEYIASRQALLH